MRKTFNDYEIKIEERGNGIQFTITDKRTGFEHYREFPYGDAPEPEPPRMTFNVTSESDHNVKYVVRAQSDGKWDCDCPDAKYRMHECKHIQKVKLTLKGL